MDSLVSIILPIYNAEKYLARCLDSIVNQSYKNLELIAIDDGSSDGSWNILTEYAAKYPWIRAFSQENQGVSKTRNRGILLAQGEFLLLIDNDDYYDLDYVAVFVREIKESNSDVVVGGYKRPNKDNRIIEQVELRPFAYAKYKVVAAWAKIYRTAYIKEKQIEFLNSNIGEDIFFTMQAVTLTDRIKIISYVGYNWFYNEESVSNTKHKAMTGLSFEFLLHTLYQRLAVNQRLDDEYIEYYFIKLIVWFFMYTAKGTDYEVVIREKNKYLNWLADNFPAYKKNRLVSFFRPKGEDLRVRVIVKVFIFATKIHLDNLFLKVYRSI